MASGDRLKKTPLHGLHVELEAKLVPFAGYEMPIQYPSGILQEHNHVRNGAGLFDVSHMGQVWLSGSDSAPGLETLVPGDIVGLAPFTQRYTILTNDQGGIIDDLMVTNADDKLCIVVNAACKETDIALLHDHLSSHCTVEPQPGRALLALQGPEAAAVMARFSIDATSLVFMTAAWTEIAGARCFTTRSGYTGEDGFEISVAADDAEAVARALLDEPEVAPIGPGARDSLRLEAGLCLYGQDIDPTTSPIEAALTWVVAKSRRADGARPGGFPGTEVVFDHMANGIARKRVGIRPEGRAPVRTGTALMDADGRSVGVITSGGYGPTVGAPVAMGYVETNLAKLGTALTAMVRGKPLPVTVCKQSFVPHRYYRG